MSSEPLSIKNYLLAPTNISFDFDVESQELTAVFNKQLSFGKGVILKWLYLKKIRKSLIKEKKIKPFSLHLKWKLKPIAYMRDEGRLFLSFGLLITRSASTALAVYIHELSHIWLSQRENYPEIKTLQRKFRERFGKNELCELMSPIEIYASLLTLKILRSIERNTSKRLHKKRLLRLINDKAEKLSFLTSELKELAKQQNEY